jgi:hypothetical protein
MNEAMIARIERVAGVGDLLGVLTERLAPSDLQSLLLEVYARLARKMSPAEVLEQYVSNRFVAPSSVDAKKLVEVDRVALSLLPEGYVPLELSPLCPLGTTSAVATVSQHKVVSTIRNTEVVADSTNVLALECAVRRRRLKRVASQRRQPVLLAASQRVTRSQAFKGPGLSAHFRLLSLCAAGRDEGSHAFESRHLVEQISSCVRLLQHAGTLGSHWTDLRIAVTDFTGGRLATTLEQQVLQPLAARFPDVPRGFDPQRSGGRGYYDDVCFNVWAKDASGQEQQLADGGVTRWTRRLLSDEKERLVIGGLGIERLCWSSAPPRT